MTVTEDNNDKTFTDDVGMGNEEPEEATPAVAIAKSDSNNEEDEEATPAVAVAKSDGNNEDDEEATPAIVVAKSVRLRNMLKEKKKSVSYELGEDVYAFIFVAPVFSVPFFFSLYVIATKIIMYAILVEGISFGRGDSYSKGAQAAKFFLVPVAIAMQEDLIKAYFLFANVTYSPSALKISTSATKAKLGLSWLLRTFDGLFSLVLNFYVMLTTQEILGVFLNFAALQFLQSIDDVFYELVQLGFFGDKMEAMSTLCKQIELPRRSGEDNTKLGCFRISHLDTILFGLTFFICIVLYAVTAAGLAGGIGGFPFRDEI